LQRIEAGDVRPGHVLLIESFDRLNRQAPLDALGPFTAIINAGVTIVTLLDGQSFTRDRLSTDGGISLLMSLLVMVRAHEESLTKSRRVGAAWEKKRTQASTHKLTAMCPGWLRLKADRSGFDIIDVRADIVRRIFRETAGGIGKGIIASRLNSAGIPSFRGANGWHASYVHKLIWSDAVLGTYQPHTLVGGRRQPWGPPVPSYFPEILDVGLVESARAAAISRRTGAAGRRGATVSNIFAGAAVCQKCGSRMAFISKGGEEQYLTCSSARRSSGCDTRTLFNYRQAEREVLDLIDQIRSPEMPSKSPRLGSPTGEELSRTVASLSARLRRMLSEFGDDDCAETADAIREIRTRKMEAERSLAASREGELVNRHRLGLMEVKSRIARLRRSMSTSNDETLFKARSDLSQVLRAAGLRVEFSAQNRSLALIASEASLEIGTGSCSPPRHPATRDRAGRFRGSGT
jgi:hypothetical protein